MSRSTDFDGIFDTVVKKSPKITELLISGSEKEEKLSPVISLFNKDSYSSFETVRVLLRSARCFSIPKTIAYKKKEEQSMFLSIITKY